MEITFIRHGEKEFRKVDSFLTKKGLKQAKYLARKLKGEKFDEFYCSDMHRAKQTAEVISKKIRIKPKIVKTLNEFYLLGKMRENKSKWPKEEQVHYKALISFLDKITKRLNSKKSILIVAHGITNRLILSYLTKIDIIKIFPFTQKETGINVLSWSRKFKNWRVVSWNSHHHLPRRFR